MVSKSALEQAELMAEIERRGNEQVRKEQNAEVRRGLFMLLFTLIVGFFKLVFAMSEKSGGSSDISDWTKIK